MALNLIRQLHIEECEFFEKQAVSAIRLLLSAVAKINSLPSALTR